MIKVLSLFSGIGAFEKALTNQGIPYELVNYCEFDKYASKSFSLIHNEPESKNLGDITKIDVRSLPHVDLITYGFPRQDISLAGKQKGFEDENGERTRSGLFFNALEIIEHLRPAVAIAENVKNLTSKKFEKEFKIVLDSLDAAGYNNYWKVLNSKDYGIPQNRERVFIISIRKDLDHGLFEFPEPYELKLRLKDLLEDEVDEKYFISMDDEKIKPILDRYNESMKNKTENPNLHAVRFGNIYGEKFGTGYAGNVWDSEQVCPTLTTVSGGGRQPHIVVRTNNKKGYDIALEGDSINLEQPNSKTRRGRVGHGVAQTLNTSCNQAVIQKVGNIYPSGGQNGNVYDANGISPTIASGTTGTKGNGGIGSNNSPKIVVTGNYSPSNHDASRIVSPDGIAPTVKENHGTVTATIIGAAIRGRYDKDGNITQNVEISNNEYSNSLTTVQKDSLVFKDMRIRKLTPKECFRLQGFDDADIDVLTKNGISNTQAYKMAGNSITVDVMEEIFCMLFDEEGEFYI